MVDHTIAQVRAYSIFVIIAMCFGLLYIAATNPELIEIFRKNDTQQSLLSLIDAAFVEKKYIPASAGISVVLVLSSLLFHKPMAETGI